jgi:hypothetical protein
MRKIDSLGQCTLFDVHVSQWSLIWKTLESGEAACHDHKAYIGRNRCYATGFTRLFCPITENIGEGDRLELSPYISSNNVVEHLTLAVTGGHHTDMSLSNAQMQPAKRVKILLLLGHLVVTDINLDMHIRVEYGWDCDEFSLSVPAGFSATRYRRFDGGTFTSPNRDRFIDLPRCFRLISNSLEQSIQSRESMHDFMDADFNDELRRLSNLSEHHVNVDNDTDAFLPTVNIDHEPSIAQIFANLWRDKNS